MDSWIHLFSKFTSEALLFEGLFICVILVGYTAFWVLKKRRFGSLRQQVPSSVVQVYLGQLINEARLVRSQLFGLITEAGALPEGMTLQAASAAVPSVPDAAMKEAATKIAQDPNLSGKLAELQKNLEEQIKNTEKVNEEKKAIEAELEKLKNGAPSTSDGGDQSDQVAELQKKIKSLEDRLAEYSVIEDDLANLKRLQQENQELKSKLASGGSETEAASTPADSKAEESATTSASSSPEANDGTSGADEEVKASDEPAAKEEKSVEPSPDPEAAESKADPGFENLVDQVEESLQPSEEVSDQSSKPEEKDEPKQDAAPEAPSAPAEKEPEPTTQTEEADSNNSESATTAPPATSEKKAEEPNESKSDETTEKTGKSDDDLLSEFEKMLNM